MKHLLLTTIAAVLLVGWGNLDRALVDAARDGSIALVRRGLSRGADVNAKDDGGWSPLHSASTLGHKKIAELLIDKGADVNAQSDGGSTPLHAAPQGGHKGIAELLIAEGADVNAKDDGGRTPLHGTAYWGRKEIVEVLIANGADVNVNIEAGELKGLTPLDAATHPDTPNASAETAAILRKHGGKTGEELLLESN